ncbi:MAG TPA: glycosyltransferase family 2 protein [Isosphaeraceae bacterium]|jgi:glycosyltransferase involved in cell wall biosynthesis|nr:glycosyltransferase family 2 protein [Isosphaeraceae bacterium]
MTLRHDPAHRPGPSGPGRGGTLSVVVPARDEAASLPTLLAEVADALRPLRDRPGRGRRLEGFEVLVVDDGSTDDTRSVLHGLQSEYHELRPILLARNAGQSAAIAAGLREARGDWVATLDADLQNPPAALATLWDALPGFDAALGWRVDRRDPWHRRAVGRWANRVRNRALGQAIRDTGCSARIFRREAGLRLPLFRGAHRFLGPLLLREGCRVVQVPVPHRPRRHGRSHYNVWNRSLNVVADLLGVAWLLRRPVAYEVVRAPTALPRPHRPVPQAVGREA